MALLLHSATAVGSYSLFDHFGWVLPGMSISDDVYIMSTVFTSLSQNIRLLCFASYLTDDSISSLSAFMKNSVWVERESSEMLNLLYSGLLDTRKLLLDYSTGRGVLHKKNNKVFLSNFFKNYYFVNYEPF